MTAFTGSGPEGTELCKALGLDPQRTRGIKLSVSTDAVPGLVRQLREYVLVPLAKLGQEEVLAQVRAARNAQEKRWGPDHDDQHGPLAWTSLINEHLAKAGRELEWGSVADAKPHVVIVAALAVAWLESSARRSRR